VIGRKVMAAALAITLRQYHLAQSRR